MPPNSTSAAGPPIAGLIRQTASEWVLLPTSPSHALRKPALTDSVLLGQVCAETGKMLTAAWLVGILRVMGVLFLPRS
jgi:hypothetical protein